MNNTILKILLKMYDSREQFPSAFERDAIHYYVFNCSPEEVSYFKKIQDYLFDNK